MTRIGDRNVYLTGSRRTVQRVIRKAENGTYWMKWGGNEVEVKNTNGEGVTSGWRTVEAY